MQEQLDRVKAFRADAFNQGHNLDALRKSAKNLTDAMKDLGMTVVILLWLVKIV